MADLLFFFENPPLMVQALINGIVIGSLFALAAYGMALVWGVMDIINVCQGEFVILGGYIALLLYNALGLNPILAIPIAMVVLFILGAFLYKLVIYRIIGKDMFVSLLATFGLSILFQQLMNQFFGADIQLVDANFGSVFFMDNMVSLPLVRLYALFISMILGFTLYVFMKRSRIGKAIRATAQNARAARVLGVKTDTVYTFTYGINAALCGAAGALVVTIFAIHPYIGLPYTLRSFMIVIFAGIGNITGVIFSATFLGVFEEAADFVLGSEFRLAAVFGLLILLLAFRNWKLDKIRQYLK